MDINIDKYNYWLDKNAKEIEEEFLEIHDDEFRDFCLNKYQEHLDSEDKIDTQKMKWENITKEQFDSYEKVRKSGVTNMWSTQKVSELSEKYGTKLDENTILEIIKNWNNLLAKFQIRGEQNETN